MKTIYVAAALAAAAASAPAFSAVTFYTGTSGKTAFTTATGSYTTTEGFDGITTPTSSGIGSVSYGTVFSRNGLTITDTSQFSTLTVLDNTYLNGGNQIRNRFGSAAGSVLDAGYGSLTFTFANPVTAFGLDLATIARGFAGNSSGTFTITADGASNSYLYSGSSGFGFLGLTSDTAISSITLTAPTANDDVFDNITFGAATAAVPEPASWAMMIGGFGLVGGAMRRRGVASRQLTA